MRTVFLILVNKMFSDHMYLADTVLDGLFLFAFQSTLFFTVFHLLLCIGHQKCGCVSYLVLPEVKTCVFVLTSCGI